jgi:hypothetical protein
MHGGAVVRPTHGSTGSTPYTNNLGHTLHDKSLQRVTALCTIGVIGTRNDLHKQNGLYIAFQCTEEEYRESTLYARFGGGALSGPERFDFNPEAPLVLLLTLTQSTGKILV